MYCSQYQATEEPLIKIVARAFYVEGDWKNSSIGVSSTGSTIDPSWGYLLLFVRCLDLNTSYVSALTQLHCRTRVDSLTELG